MTLIPVESDRAMEGEGSLTRLVMSAEAKRLAEVETAEVKRDQAKVKVNLAGMVYEDETKVAALTARVDGRLDEIYVDFTGIRVRQGDPMVKIWSPTLIKSQVELFETLRTLEKGRASEDDAGVIRGAEEKLLQLGLTKEQIATIEKNKKPDLYVTLKAPISGTVTKKMAVLGQFVKEGQDMYLISDFSEVWVKMDAYETDLPWIRYGQDVTFTTPAIPGKSFKGRVLFIDPVLDTKTRSVKVRVQVPNPDELLRPGMFVSAELEAEVDAEGRVIKSEWAGKYICPVHPRESASITPGTCVDSKMPLRPASAFGYTDEANPEPPLVIPATAPLITGKRAIVYVEVPGTDQPTYELREVVLGPRAGGKYLVYQGLNEGERVVTQGNFKIDSAMQILARYSMMTAEQIAKIAPTAPKTEEEVIRKLKVPAEFVGALTPLIQEYLVLKDALVDEKAEEARDHGAKLQTMVQGLAPKGLDKQADKLWQLLSGTITDGLTQISASKEVQTQRKAFDPVSEAFSKLVMSFGHAMNQPLSVYLCPMAFDEQGAYWIEQGDDKRNPYFGNTQLKGQDMLQCGDLVQKIPPQATSSKPKGESAVPGEPGPGRGATSGKMTAEPR